jgi:hypothetical protein
MALYDLSLNISNSPMPISSVVVLNNFSEYLKFQKERTKILEARSLASFPTSSGLRTTSLVGRNPYLAAISSGLAKLSRSNKKEN